VVSDAGILQAPKLTADKVSPANELVLMNFLRCIN